MSVNFNAVNSYQTYQSSYNKASVKEKKENEKAKDVGASQLPVTNGQKKLSKAAQELLEKIRKQHSDKDIMVADFDKGDDAQEILSRGTKEFSVLFSSDELEKMAADENYYKEKMAAIDGAIRMSEEINAKFGFERGASGVGENAGQPRMTRFGISLNDDGTTTFFAELEKMSERQKEWLDKALEKRAEEKKAQEHSPAVKKVTVYASTEEELLRQISEIDWSKVKEDTSPEGRKFDYSV